MHFLFIEQLYKSIMNYIFTMQTDFNAKIVFYQNNSAVTEF